LHNTSLCHSSFQQDSARAEVDTNVYTTHYEESSTALWSTDAVLQNTSMTLVQQSQNWTRCSVQNWKRWLGLSSKPRASGVRKSSLADSPVTESSQSSSTGSTKTKGSVSIALASSHKRYLLP